MRISFPTPIKAQSTKTFSYKDIDLTLARLTPANFHLEKQKERKDLNAIFDTKAVYTSLHTLFSTMPGQKLLNPIYGMNLITYLFEPMTDNLLAAMGQTIQNAIRRYEPRITVTKMDISGQKEDNTVNIAIYYTIEGLPALQSLKVGVTKNGVVFD